MTDIEISFIGMNISVFSVRSALPLATEGTQEFCVTIQRYNISKTWFGVTVR